MRVQAAGDGCAGPPTLPEHDPALPGLALLREPTRLLGLVQAAWSERLAPSSLVGVEPVVRRYLPGKRCVAEVVLRVSPPVPAPPRAIAKLGSARWAQRTYANVRELWTHGFSAAPFRVPEPLAYVPEWNLLLLDFTEGDVLRERLLARADDESAEREIALAAQWLARLHRSGATPLRRYTLEDHRRALSAGTKRVAPVDAGAARELETILRRVMGSFASLPADVRGPTHRDFSPENVVVDGGLVVWLDLDELCNYLPACDVAHFIRHLAYLGARRRGDWHAFDRLAVRFLDVYLSHGVSLCQRQLELFAALADLKLAIIAATVGRGPSWRELVRELLRHSATLVDTTGALFGRGS